MPITLNAIPVSSGGNVTINEQQYIADYVDVENGKIVKCVEKLFLKQAQWGIAINKGVLRFYGRTNEALGIDGSKIIKNVFQLAVISLLLLIRQIELELLQQILTELELTLVLHLAQIQQ